MKLKHYELICLMITLFMGYEYAIFNGYLHAVSYIRKIEFFLDPHYRINTNPAPGYPLSYFLGWLGFSIMLLMNVYTVRKRLNFFREFGKLSRWLEFHIFCGILGPVFIIFHTNFKIEGLVAISFWSMIIASSSGLVGRYFYLQTLKKKDELENIIALSKNEFIKQHRDKFTDEKFEEIFQYSYKIAGVVENMANPFYIFASSLKSDFRLMFVNPGKLFGLDKQEGDILKKMGVNYRRSLILEPFNQLLGYWHSFHLPFAFFMYVVAVIHIVAAMLFAVKH